MNIEVVFLPPIATDLPSKLCVVIDVLRATSTAVAMLEAGARRIVLADSHSAALERAEASEERCLVCGESGGLPPAGFDMGNSPREFRPEAVKGRELVFCTSNGTRAMRSVSEAPVVLAGCMLNGSAVAREAVRIARDRGLNIAVVCSGDYLGTKFAIDDSFCAGYLVTLMQKEAGATLTADAEHHRFPRSEVVREDDGHSGYRLEESAVAAVRLYGSYLLQAGISDLYATPPKEAILRAFWESHNAATLRRVGLAEDVEYCAQLDISNRVPRLQLEDGNLVIV